MRFGDIVFVVLVFSFVSVGFAQSTGAAFDSDNLTVPYIAEITGDNVYVRSGPGTQYYDCIKLNKGDRVKVVGIKNGWARITPPVDCFSWISQRYVSVDPNVPGVGIVTGEPVIVRSGSSDGNPLHSETEQAKLHRGERVAVIGEYGSDYYKIVPPQGVYLWVSEQFIRALGKVGQIAIVTRPTIEPQPQVTTVPVVTATGTETAADTNSPVSMVTVVPTKISSESSRLAEYYVLEKKVAAEKTKPLSQQDYSDIKKDLMSIVDDKSAGKAARYAKFAIEQIERCELAKNVGIDSKLQDKQFEQIMANIKKARAAKLAEIETLGRFAVVGQFKISIIYGLQKENRHYQILDEAGRIVCFALPTGQASNMNLDDFVGKKVGLVGSIEPHPATSGAMVRFTEIVALN